MAMIAYRKPRERSEAMGTSELEARNAAAGRRYAHAVAMAEKAGSEAARGTDSHACLMARRRQQRWYATARRAAEDFGTTFKNQI